LRHWAEQQFGPDADQVLALYPTATDSDAGAVAAQVQGDLLFLQGARSVLRAVSHVNPRTFRYQFTRVNAIGRRIGWGSFHGSEVPYVFGTLPDSLYGTDSGPLADFSVATDSYVEQDRELSAAMSSAWVRFAKTGNPNGRGLPAWPAFASGRDRYLEFGDRIVDRAAIRIRQLDFLSDFNNQRQR
jgi:para-nitrobenzyl esterase